jgi:hypothetical protein
MVIALWVAVAVPTPSMPLTVMLLADTVDPPLKPAPLTVMVWFATAELGDAEIAKPLITSILAVLADSALPEVAALVSDTN